MNKHLTPWMVGQIEETLKQVKILETTLRDTLESDRPLILTHMALTHCAHQSNAVIRKPIKEVIAEISKNSDVRSVEAKQEISDYWQNPADAATASGEAK